MDAGMSEFAFVSGPDFSPQMLRVILQARAALRRELGETEDVVARAGVTAGQFHQAWRGWLRKAEPRLKLWGALGVVPADHGVTLTDDGGQFLASRDAPAAAPPVAPEGPRTSSDGQSPLRPVAGVDGVEIQNGGCKHATQ